jgi:superfamily II DNA/RNA helicase
MLRNFFWCILFFRKNLKTIWPTKQLILAISSSMDNVSPQIVSSSTLDWAHPVVHEWFLTRLGAPTEPQQRGWPQILAGKTTLISAPTGSGKTLAAFLACIDRLVRKALAGELRDETQVLYVSPLKALENDIQKNLEIPLGEILQLAGERGLLMSGDSYGSAHRRHANAGTARHADASAPHFGYDS